MSELARFQADFAAALAGDEASLDSWTGGTPAAGLSVYRNTVAKGMADALAANFPTVERLVGEDWFKAAALAFAADHPPPTAALADYGAGFAEWLAAFEPAAAMPYLPAVARLDQLWMETHLAADAEPIDAAALAGLGPEALARTRAVLHPSARFAWFDDNCASLWLANRPPAAPPDDFELADAPEGMLLVRSGLVVENRRLDAPAYAFVAACAAGESLAEAAAAALAAGSGDGLAAIVAACLDDGLFIGLAPLGEDL